MSEITKIPVSNVNQLEWLALESLWATAKSPFEIQWQRWLSQTNIEDPSSTSGLVISGNLQRFHVNVSNARAFSKDGVPDRQMLSLAAEHLGKMAGGLVGIVTHTATKPHRWSLPLEQHVETHIKTTEDIIVHANEIPDVSFDPEEYYTLLKPVLEAVQNSPQRATLNRESGRLSYIASLAVKTWDEFMTDNQDLEIVPGATPRSTGTFIEDLRANFEQFVPTIHEATQRN